MPEYKFDWATLNYVHRDAVLSYDERMAAWWAKTLPVWKNEIPFDHIATIECKDKVFAFTGLCDWAVKNMLGIEKQFADDYWHTREWIGELGGICQKDVTLRCDYLIVGLHAEKTNRSVETAIRYRDSGNSRIKIIPEDELLKILEKEAAEISVVERVSVNPLEYIEDHPEISISGKKFVFTGLSAFKSDEKNMPIVQKLMARGGLHREEISGVTDYLVVCSEEPSEHKLNQVITLQKAVKPIQIIRLKDFEVALNRTKEDGPRVLNGEASATSEHKDSLLKAAEEKKLQRLEKAKERQRLAEEAARQKEEHQRFMALLIYTGMRREEALALRWADIDFERGFIHVHGAITFQGNKPVEGPTKTEKGNRYIPLIDALRPWLLQRSEGNFVVYDKVTSSFVKRMWERIQREINVYGATPHCFRHTFTTIAYHNGVNEKTLQALGGWSDIATMRDIYTHVDFQELQNAKISLNAFFQAKMW